MLHNLITGLVLLKTNKFWELFCSKTLLSFIFSSVFSRQPNWEICWFFLLRKALKITCHCVFVSTGESQAITCLSSTCGFSESVNKVNPIVSVGSLVYTLIPECQEKAASKDHSLGVRQGQNVTHLSMFLINPGETMGDFFSA